MPFFYDLGVAWEWEYDFDFVSLIGERCRRKNLSVFYVTSKNLSDVYKGVKSGEIKFFVYFDRASDTNEDFLELNFLLENLGVRMINRYEDMLRASDKATMHFELLNHGVEVPYTLVIPPFDESPTLEIDSGILKKIGAPFVSKPSTETGGGIGVKIGHSIEDIIEARKEIPYDNYLVQRLIHPVQLDKRKAWFRAFYVFDEVLICWWDNELKVYETTTGDDIERYKLGEIENIMRRIYHACKLDFFSSEIAISSEDGKFVVIDYVNEMCDMRLKSKAVDGVPDEIVEAIGERFAEFIANLK